MSDGSMAYPYDYLEESRIPLPIYAPQHAPCSIDNSDTPFEEWPVAARPATRPDTDMSNGSYHRYTSNIGYLNQSSSHTHWHPGPPLGVPGLVPQFSIPLPEQWQGSTSPIALHMAPEMEPGQFYPLATQSVSSSLPPRGEARPAMLYEGYDAPPDWRDPHDSLPRMLYRNRKSAAPNSSRARADSSRPRTSKTMSSRIKRSQNPSPDTGLSPSLGAQESSVLNQVDYPQASEERQFACGKGCPARFARKRDRDRHERSIHTGQTPYHCMGCQTGFVRSDARGRHWKAEPECHKKHLLAEMLEEPSPGPD